MAQSLSASYTNFLAECAVRSRSFRRAVTIYHRTYPPLLVSVCPPSLRSLPRWLERRVERRGEALVVLPRNFGDVQQLTGSPTDIVAWQHGLRRLHPRDGAPYFAALARPGYDDARWRQDWSRLLDRFPHIRPEVIEAPGSFKAKGLVLSAVECRLDPTAPRGRSFSIPLIPGMTEAEAVAAFRLAQEYGFVDPAPQKRPSAADARRMLVVFDAAEDLQGDVGLVAKRVGIDRRSVRRLLDSAHHWIEWTSRPRRRRARTRTAAATRREEELRGELADHRIPPLIKLIMRHDRISDIDFAIARSERGLEGFGPSWDDDIYAAMKTLPGTEDIVRAAARVEAAGGDPGNHALVAVELRMTEPEYRGLLKRLRREAVAAV